MYLTPRTLIKSALRRRGWDIVRYVPEVTRPFSVLPLLVREQLSSAEPFFFVQVGANDGTQDDPIRELVLKHDLHGMLVEPLPDMFKRLRENYRHSSELIFENVAVGTEAGTAPIYRVRHEAAGLTSSWHSMASFSRQHLRIHGVPDEEIEKCLVPVVTLESLLQKHQIRNVSLLQVDTEGYDFSIVKSALDSRILPKIINYEHRHLNPWTRSECKRLLDANGYRFIDVGPDTLAIRESAI